MEGLPDDLPLEIWFPLVPSRNPQPPHDRVPGRPEVRPPASGEVLSPELVLVSPELAELARASLPDPAPTARVTRSSPVRLEGRRAVGRSRTTRRLVWLVAVLAAAAGVAAVPAIAPEQRSAVPNASAHRDPSERGPKTLPDAPLASEGEGPRSAPIEPEPASGPAPQAVRPALTTQPKATVTRRRIAPIPGAGYVFGPNSYFQIGSGGRSLVNFNLAIGCESPLVLPTIRVSRDGAFSFDSRVRMKTGQRVRVRLRGRFVSERAAGGTIRLDSPSCTRRVLRFSAKLS